MAEANTFNSIFRSIIFFCLVTLGNNNFSSKGLNLDGGLGFFANPSPFMFK